MFAVAMLYDDETQFYDPNQSRQEKSEINEEYVDLIQRLEEKRDELIRSEDMELGGMIDRAGILFNQKVRTTTDSTLDMRFLDICTDIGISKMRNLDRELGMVLNVEAILNRLGELVQGKDGWETLGEMVLRHSCILVSMDFMLGPLQTIKTRKPVVRTKRTEEQEVQPTVDEKIVDNVLEGASGRIMHLQKLIEQKQSIGYFEWIVDPDSFSKTVENCFHTAFMVKNGHILLEINSRGETILTAKAAPTDDDRKNGLKKKTHGGWIINGYLEKGNREIQYPDSHNQRLKGILSRYRRLQSFSSPFLDVMMFASWLARSAVERFK